MNSGTEGVLSGEMNLIIWRACLTVAHVTAILSSIFRLYRRRKTGQFWIDDCFAMGASFIDCAFFPTLWTLGVDSKNTLIATAWLSQLLFIPLIWGTRISLAFSIARVIPPHQNMRKVAIFLVYLFGFLCVGFIIQTSITCGQTYRNWSSTVPRQCPITPNAAIARVAVDCICDFALILVPFCAFWRRLKLPLTTRRLIQACFCASSLTALCSMLIAGILFSHHNSKFASQRAETSFIASVMCHLMASTSLLVCNILIVVTSFYRFFRPEEVVRPIGAPEQQPPIPVAPPFIAQQSSVSSQNQSQPVTENAESSGSGTQSISGSDRIELTEIFESEFAPSELIETSMTPNEYSNEQ